MHAWQKARFYAPSSELVWISSLGYRYLPFLLMSGEPKGIPQHPMDPEKGTLDSPPLQLPWDGDLKAHFKTADIPPGLHDSEKKDATVTTTTKEVVVAAKPKRPVKRKVSKWVLWRLWFNTYRYISFSSLSPSSPNTLS